MNKKILLFILFFTLCMLPNVYASDIIYVSADGNDAGDGSSSNPFYNITTAMDNVNEEKNIIVLKNGSYSQSNININKSVTIIGQKNAVLNGNHENWIFNISNRQSNVTLINLTLINAYSSGFGAAIINNATLTVENVKFINNSARSAPAIDNSANLSVINSCFIGNDAFGRDGGALSNINNALIINSTFINNSASRNGGAVKSQGNKIEIINSTFINNTAFGNDNYGGAVYIWASKAFVFNSTFIANHGGYGGAIFIGGGSTYTTQLNVTQSVFNSNKALLGDALDIEEGFANISYCKLLDEVQVFKTINAKLDYNWWGSNSPDWQGIIASPKPTVHAVLNISNDDGKIKTGVYWVNTDVIVNKIPELIGSIEINSTDKLNAEFKEEFEFKLNEGSNISVHLDNEIKNLTVDFKIKTYFVAQDVLKYFGGKERFKAQLKDINGNALSNQSIIININNVNYTLKTNANGSASLALNLNSGKYDASVFYISQHKNYSSSNTTVLINILPTVNGGDVVKVYRNSTQYTATFIDSQGNYLADGSEVHFNINGVLYARTVKSNGIAKLNLNLEQGTYVLTAINNITGEKTANNITIIPRIINNTNLTKYYRNASQYVVSILGDDGKPISGEVVVFNINGVFYNRTSNANGQARLNINLQPGEYVITAEYKKCRVSNSIKVLSVLTAKDLTKKYAAPDQFIVNLLDGVGNPLAGEKVEFNINGVFYKRTANNDGQAKLNIKLQAGEYIITSSYNGANIANKVTVTS